MNAHSPAAERLRTLPCLLLLSVNLIVTFFIRTADGFSAKSFSPPYCVNLRCQIKPSRRDDFVSLIRENQRLTLADEPEALQYTVGEDVETPDVFYIHEQFTSPEAFAHHRDTPHNAEWQKFRATEPFAEGGGGEPVVAFYRGTHEPARVPVRDAYCLNVKLCIDPTVRNEFLRVIEENARGSNIDEPLCLQYVWGEDEAEADVFHFHEQYGGGDGGREGFEAHVTSPHFARWEEFASKDPFTEPPVVQFYRTL